MKQNKKKSKKSVILNQSKGIVRRERNCPIWPNCDCIIQGKRSDCTDKLY